MRSRKRAEKAGATSMGALSSTASSAATGAKMMTLAPR